MAHKLRKNIRKALCLGRGADSTLDIGNLDLPSSLTLAGPDYVANFGVPTPPPPPPVPIAGPAVIPIAGPAVFPIAGPAVFPIAGPAAGPAAAPAIFPIAGLTGGPAARPLMHFGAAAKRHKKNLIKRVKVVPFRLDMIEETFTDEQKDRLPDERTKPLEESYYIGDRLGDGGFSIVSAMEHKVTHQKVASKQLTKINTDADIKYVEREVQILNALDHENIVKMVASYRMKGKRLFIDMELCGKDLERFLKRFPTRMENKYIKYILQSILRGCEHMHSRLVVHRDIKPGNILMTESGMVKITDFGLARFFEKSEPGRVRHYSKSGTPYYMAPEVLGGSSDFGWEVDIWAVGCIAHELYFLEPLNQDSATHRPEHVLANVKDYCRPKPGSIPDVIARLMLETGTDFDHYDFLQALLTINHLERPPAGELLAHPYFKRGDLPTDALEMSVLYKSKFP